MKKGKLVRDRIPEIMEGMGMTPRIRIADPSEMKGLLTEKLKEEVAEFVESGKPEELIDILQVLYELALEHGMSRSVFETKRAEKSVARGAFLDRIVLEEP